MFVGILFKFLPIELYIVDTYWEFLFLNHKITNYIDPINTINGINFPLSWRLEDFFLLKKVPLNKK